MGSSPSATELCRDICKAETKNNFVDKQIKPTLTKIGAKVAENVNKHNGN